MSTMAIHTRAPVNRRGAGALTGLARRLLMGVIQHRTSAIRPSWAFAETRGDRQDQEYRNALHHVQVGALSGYTVRQRLIVTITNRGFSRIFADLGERSRLQIGERSFAGRSLGTIVPDSTW